MRHSTSPAEPGRAARGLERSGLRFSPPARCVARGHLTAPAEVVEKCVAVDEVVDRHDDRGVELLELAQSPKPKKGWAETLDAARAWQSDAERAQSQWAMGESGERELDPALRPSEGASETGKKMLELTGVKLSRAK